MILKTSSNKRNIHMSGKVTFEKRIIEEAATLAPGIQFTEFAQLAIRAELARRRQDHPNG
jgi:hypothetical protein